MYIHPKTSTKTSSALVGTYWFNWCQGSILGIFWDLEIDFFLETWKRSLKHRIQKEDSYLNRTCMKRKLFMHVLAQTQRLHNTLAQGHLLYTQDPQFHTTKPSTSKETARWVSSIGSFSLSSMLPCWFLDQAYSKCSSNCWRTVKAEAIEDDNFPEGTRHCCT